MNPKRRFRQKLLALALGLLGSTGMALAVEEIEPNNLLGSAHKLSKEADLAVTTDGATIYGAIAAPSPWPDVDFYSFYGRKDQKVTFRIQDTGSFNAVLTLVGPGSAGQEVKAEKVAAFQGQEVALEAFPLDATGMWSVVVTPFNMLIGNPQATQPGSLYASGSRLYSPTSGRYTLAISPATPPVLQIGIKVKPGSGDRAPINPKAMGVIPVALLASEEFNPFDIELDSLTFGAAGTEQSLRRCAGGGADLDGDGDLDRVCHFDSQAASFTEASTMGLLKGKTKDGRAFEGQGWLKALPMQPKH